MDKVQNPSNSVDYQIRSDYHIINDIIIVAIVVFCVCVCFFFSFFCNRAHSVICL
jgi:hypothetical protein